MMSKRKHSESAASGGQHERYKIFHDSVHGTIEIHPLLVKMIDTPEFQRLRNLKQMGGVHLVFPGATHNRFEHSIGVAHLAGQLVQSLMDKQKDLNITEKDKLCVQIAGLCHDLGHGPFSHLFEEIMEELEAPNEISSKWEHEKQSEKMFNQLIEKNVTYNKKETTIKKILVDGAYTETTKDDPNTKFAENDFKFICELIQGPKHHQTGSEWRNEGRTIEKSFLYDIVSNKATGIDVDKMDYLSRDFHHLGMKCNFSHDRFIKFARVCDVGTGTKQICMRDKEAMNMYELFHCRHMLHCTVNQHRVKVAAETMILDALKEAKDYKRACGNTITEAARDPEMFLTLTDSIIEEIMLAGKIAKKEKNERLKEKKLVAAYDILSDMEERNYYKFVQSKLFNLKKDEEMPKVDKQKLVADWLKEINKTERPEDFRVKIVKMDYGMKQLNPIDNLRFYTKEDQNTAKQLSKSEVSFLLPESFLEIKVMLFCTNREFNISNEEKEMFWKYITKYLSVLIYHEKYEMEEDQNDQIVQAACGGEGGDDGDDGWQRRDDKYSGHYEPVKDVKKEKKRKHEQKKKEEQEIEKGTEIKDEQKKKEEQEIETKKTEIKDEQSEQEEQDE